MKKPVHVCIALVILVLIFSITAPAAFAGGSPANLAFLVNGKAFVGTASGSDAWTMTVEGQTYSLSRQADGTLSFTQGSTRIASGKLSGDTLVMNGAEKPFLTVKIGAEKIRFSLVAGDPDPLLFKFKDDKIKVGRDTFEIGKVKFYADTRKLKAKTEAEVEVAVARDCERLSAVLAPFLLEKELPLEQRVFLALLMMSLGR